MPNISSSETCDCKCGDDFMCVNIRCNAPELSNADIAANVADKPWMVFVHGGEWSEASGIDEHYAMLASKVAAAAQVGVLAIDYRDLNTNPEVSA